MKHCLYLADVNPLFDEKLLEACCERLPAWRFESVQRLRHPADRARSTGAYLLLLKALELAGITAAAPAFTYGVNKKPYLKDMPGLYFNLSHSGNAVSCILSENECGCDIQEPSDMDFEKIAGRFFHEKEYRLIAQTTDAAEKKRLFLDIWAMKESCIKATGRGMSQELSAFAVSPVDDTVSMEGCFVRHYRPPGFPGYALGACCLGVSPPEKTALVDLLPL